MQHAIFACMNTLAVGVNAGIIIGGGKYDPIASAIIIAICGTLAGWELIKLGRQVTTPR